MANLVSITTDVAGQINVNPRNVKIISKDSLATVTAASYLNPAALEGFTIFPTDKIQMWYNFVSPTSPGTYGEFLPSISNGVITLSQFTGNSNAMLLNAANVMTTGGSITLLKGTGTEATNAVTVNANAGVITTSSLTTAGGSSYAITWTNSFISSSSCILLTLMGGTNTTKNITIQATAGSGTSTLTIYNNTAATALNGTIIIGFAVF